MEVFRILRITVIVTSTVAVTAIVPDPASFRPFAYDVFTPEVVKQRDSSGDKLETMKDTFSKIMAYLKNTGNKDNVANFLRLSEAPLSLFDM